MLLGLVMSKSYAALLYTTPCFVTRQHSLFGCETTASCQVPRTNCSTVSTYRIYLFMSQDHERKNGIFDKSKRPQSLPRMCSEAEMVGCSALRLSFLGCYCSGNRARAEPESCRRTRRVVVRLNRALLCFQGKLKRGGFLCVALYLYLD
jgi:hypothetical protein